MSDSQLFSSPISTAVALIIIAWLAQSLYTKWQLRRWEANFITETGAKDPPTLQYKWPLAIDLIVEAFTSDRNGTILHFFEGLVRRTSTTFEQILLGARGLDTIDPINIEAILSTQFHEFGLGTRSHNFRPLLGHGIFTQDGVDWKVSRDLLRPQFMHTRSEYFELVQDEVEHMIESLQKKSDTAIDLQSIFFRLTLDTTTAVLFGSTTSINKEAEAFANAFNEAQHVLARRGRLGDLYWLIDSFRFRRDCKTVHRYVDEIVQSALTDMESDSTASSQGSSKKYTFLKALLTRTRDPVALRDQLINVLLAGRDTTGCCLSWTFRLLAQHPAVQNRLREECLRLLTSPETELPSKESIKQLNYLDLVIREVLRLYPSVPVNARECIKTTTLPVGGGPEGKDPVFIRKGEAVGYNVYSMHRSEAIYGPDATKFRPERWEKDQPNSVDISKVGWGYLPFNGGPRACLGQEFGLLEAKYATVRMLQTFKQIEMIDSPTKDSSLEKHTLTLVLASADGCNVRLVPA